MPRKPANWIHAKGYKSVARRDQQLPYAAQPVRTPPTSIPSTQFIPYPVVNIRPEDDSNWFTDPNAMRVMLAEYGKVLLASARNLTGLRPPSRPALEAKVQPDKIDQTLFMTTNIV